MAKLCARALLFLLATPLYGQQLELRFLDVGQADAAVITTPDGKTILVDAGGGGRGSSGVLRYLTANGFDTLDLVVASHGHADHIGGMAAVLTTIPVRYYLDNGVPHTTATYQRTLAALERSGAQYLRPTARTITVGAARVRVLPPPPGGGDQNNQSVGVLVEFGRFRALFTGDSELAELAYWLERDSVPRVQVLKVAHHGSWNGTSPAWAERTRPQVAVISVGPTNSYGHPAPGVIALWERVGAKVHRTDRSGTVLVVANDDGSFVVTTQRSDPGGAVQLRPYVADSGAAAGVSPQPARACCRICTTGKACGNSCISRRYTCHQPPGCACDAKP
ncbi:MAG: ComEC/Rec2 family competence protein [Gemmatimonadales bacterium]